MPSFSPIAGLLLILGVALLWYHGAAARELADRLARQVCGDRGLQFLDDSVALISWRPRFDRRLGPCIERSYRFVYSEDGLGRAEGYLVLWGQRLETLLLAAEHEGRDGPE